MPVFPGGCPVGPVFSVGASEANAMNAKGVFLVADWGGLGG